MTSFGKLPPAEYAMAKLTLDDALKLHEDFILADDYDLDHSVYIGSLGFKAHRLVNFLKEISFQEVSFGNKSPYSFSGKIADELEVYWEEELKDSPWELTMGKFLQEIEAVELRENWPMETISSEAFHLISRGLLSDFLAAKEAFSFRDRLIFRHFTELNVGIYNLATGISANLSSRTTAKAGLMKLCRLRDELFYSFSLEGLSLYIEESKIFHKITLADAQKRLQPRNLERWPTTEEAEALGDALEAEVLWFESTVL